MGIKPGMREFEDHLDALEILLDSDAQPQDCIAHAINGSRIITGFREADVKPTQHVKDRMDEVGRKMQSMMNRHKGCS